MRVMKPLFVFGIAVDLVILLCCTISWLFEPGDRIHGFLFERSAVQYVTLFAFALAMTLLGYRFIRYVWLKREIRRIQHCKDWRKIGDTPFSKHISTVGGMLARQGVRAALSHAEHFAKQQREDTQRAHEVINFLICSLPALGLFGTMLGLSDALSAAFSKGNFGPESIQTFVSSLGTALDTTVLALACAMVASPSVWLLNRTEKEFHEQRLEILHEVAGLNRHTPRSTNSQQSDSGQTPNANIVDAVRAELQASAAQNIQIVTEIISKFDSSVSRLEEFVRVSLERACQNEVAYNQEVDPTTAVQAMNSHIDQAMGHITELMTTHNNETTRTIAAALNRFAEAMEASNVVDTIRAEVRTSMSEEMTEVNSKLQESLGRFEELVRVSHERVAKLESEYRPQIDQASLVESVTSCMNEAVGRIGDLMAEQGNQGAQAVAAALQEFTRASNARILQALITCNADHNGELIDVA